MSERIERCWICDDPTGRAGRGEDSIYVELLNDVEEIGGKGTEIGPICAECRRVLRERGDIAEE